MKKIHVLLSLLFAFQLSWSQVSIVTAGTAIMENFNSLAQTGTSNSWTDNVTLPGWYSTQTTYRAEAGSGATGALYSYGATVAPDITDRALGLLSSGTSTFFRFAIQLKNTTGASLTSFSIVYNGEQWRQNSAGSSSSQKLTFEYSTDATSISTGTWNPVTALDFTAPQTAATGLLDGNTTANRAVLSGTVTAALANNGTIWFRWSKVNSNSPGLAVDDLSITANAGVVNSITTGTVSPTFFCVDASTTAAGNVAYTAMGTYNTTFTANLSDASGSFAGLPVPVGSTTVSTTNPSGTINITIPAGTASGTGYKIRVDANSPVVTGTASSAFEIVNGAKNISGASLSTGNAQATVSWTNPVGCFDEVMVVAKTSSITATPSGDGSGYTASAAFGSGTPFNGGYVVYKGTGTSQTVTALTNGTQYYFKIFSRRGTNWSSGVEVNGTPSTQVNPGDIVINQLNPQYSGASDEYIELVNKTNASIDLGGLGIKYQSAAGNVSSTTGGILSGILLPKRYWLLSPNATVTVGQTNGLTSDGTFTAGMAAGAGQVALIRLSDNTIIDAVGYGSVTINAANPFTETASAPAPPSTGDGLKRSPDGTDNNNNSTNFIAVAKANIFLRNSPSGVVLPIRLTNLKAVQKGTSVHVSWSSAMEIGIREYAVERSANVVDFVAVAKVTPTGNLQNGANYTAVDAFPVKGLNYYRIRLTETDGKQSFSSILKLNTASATPSLFVYPNPAKGSEATLQLTNLPAGRYLVRVIGINGRVFSSASIPFTEGTSVEPLPLNRLPAGLYTVQASGPVVIQQSFIKQ